MESSNKKNVRLPLAVAVIFFGALIIGATVAYFMGNNTATGTTRLDATTDVIGTVSVLNPTENLYLKLSASEMQQSKVDTSYYATPTKNDGSNFSIGKENNIISNYAIIGGAEDTVYNCSYKISIEAPSNVRKGDMTLKLTGIGSKVEGLSVISVDLTEAKDEYTVTFSRVGNGIGNLVAGDLVLNNTNRDQSYIAGQSIKSSITLSGLNCVIETVEEPELYDGTLTPVVYEKDEWVIVSKEDKDWYDYGKQEWANAVILKSDSDKGVGDSVTVEGSNPDVLAMYVWIPRYEYKIEGKYGLGGTSASSPGEIEVNFVSKETTEASDGYIMHPAFTLGGEELAGIWVGKFEISHTSLSSSTTTNNLNCSTETCENSTGLRTLPNVQSLRRNRVSNYYYAIKSMEQSGNEFGINKETTDSHMIKNSEWGAVAYLSQSRFGKYGNDDYSGVDKEVFINNSTNFYTGRSGGSNAANEKDTPQGTYTYDGFIYNGDKKTRYMNKIASTTGNVTGIYDMSGGALEYVMGTLTNDSGDVLAGGNIYSNSGFTGKLGESDYGTGVNWPDEKYYETFNPSNIYTGSTLNFKTACNGGPCYGHAISESFWWYNNPSIETMEARSPWLIRGGRAFFGNGGIFTSQTGNGGAYAIATTRAVLTSKSSLSKEYKTYENGEVVYFDVEKGIECSNYNLENSKTGYNGIDNRTGNQNSCLKFYAFNDKGGTTVNLVLDHNTTATSLWNSSGNITDGPTDALLQLKNDTKDWKGTIEPADYKTGASGKEYTIDYKGLNARLITSNELAKIIGKRGWNERKTVDGVAFYFDSHDNSASEFCQEGNITGCKYGWLYDRTYSECELDGCSNNSEGDDTSGYWTASSSALVSTTEAHQICDGDVIYGVSSRGRQGKTCPQQEGHYGIRPVIEVAKYDLTYVNDSICTLASDSPVAAGEYGAKYNCKVDPNKDRYTFYLLNNNEDGTSDLIMNQNINSDGTPAGTIGITQSQNSAKYNLVAWASESDYGCEGGWCSNSSKGPITAMKFLYNATKNWTNVSPLNYEYYDIEYQEITNTTGYKSFISIDGISTITSSSNTSVTIGNVDKPLRARMPIYSAKMSEHFAEKISDKGEVFDKNANNEFLYENLSLNRVAPYGYRTLSSCYGGSDATWVVAYDGRVYADADYTTTGVSINNYWGIRPVITVKL